MPCSRQLAVAVTSLFLSAAADSPAPSFARPPNVLVILCDQLNARMLGHEDNGFGGVSQSLTPSLDKLAQEGVRFSNASCAAAVCAPSRYSILTGRWPHNHGVRTNTIWEPLGETTFPELARAAGYLTASIGKNHLAWVKQPPSMGADNGFDTILDITDYGGFCGANGESSYNAPANVVVMPGMSFPLELTGYTTNSNAFHPSGYFADQVIQFLEQRAGPNGDGQPFVCWYSMFGPHTPILPSGVPPDDWAHLYQPYQALALAPNFYKALATNRLKILQARFTYLTEDQHREILSYDYGLISQIDFNIGRVLRRLDELGLADETLVVFTTDHGDMATEMSCWTKGAGAYDGSTRVPLIVRLPGVLPAGRVVSAPVNNTDLFPTLTEVTGVPVPEAVRAAVDGASLLELMIASSQAPGPQQGAAPPYLPRTPRPKNTGWRLETFHEIGNAAGNRQFMVRTPWFKYSLDEVGSEEFYDLARDPWEIDDLFGHPDPAIQARIADLRARLDTWWNDELGHAPIYPQMGWVDALPVASRYPAPTNGANGVARDVDPTWQPCTGAWSQEVFLGKSAATLSLFATLTHMESDFNPGTLEPATKYYWRVDQINANGATVGPIWRFTTAAGGSGGPALATAPVPVHRSEGVPLGTRLAWTPGPGVVTQDVHFGPPDALQLVAAGLDPSATSWNPGAVAAGVAYEWRVDGSAAAGTTEGDVWTFTTSPAGLPERAQGLYPLHLQNGVPPGAVLDWVPGAGAESHDVHFGTGFPLPFRGNQTASSWDPGPLVPGWTYFWRIDEVNAHGETMGWTWRFIAL